MSLFRIGKGLVVDDSRNYQRTTERTAIPYPPCHMGDMARKKCAHFQEKRMLGPDNFAQDQSGGGHLGLGGGEAPCGPYRKKPVKCASFIVQILFRFCCWSNLY